MRKSLSRLLPLLLLPVLAAASSQAQDAQVIDLDLAAYPTGGEIEQPIEPGLAFRVRVVNRVPELDYTLRIRREVIPIPSLPDLAPSTRAAVPPDLSTCGQVILDLRKTLFAKSTAHEPEVAKAIRDHRLAASTANCTKEERIAFEDLIASATTHSFAVVVLSRGERLVADVKRLDNGETITWSLTLTTGARGVWLSTYGIGFLPNGDELYFSQSTGDEKFEVARQTDVGGLGYVPAIFFSWLPSKWANSDWAISPCGGLGFELANPVVFAGAAISYNTNLHFIVGAAFHNQKRLNGQYSEGQEIAESLTPEQLSQTTFRPNFFFSVAFRFGSNPFSTK
jgi:hypothetical protein